MGKKVSNPDPPNSSVRPKPPPPPAGRIVCGGCYKDLNKEPWCIMCKVVRWLDNRTD